MNKKFELLYFGEPTPGYTGVYPYGEDWNNFDKGELSHLYINNVLDYTPIKDVHNTLMELLSYVSKGGTVEISGLNILAIGRAIQSRILDVTGANELIFSGELCRVSTSDAFVLIKTLESRGFKILSKRIDGYEYFISAIRN